MAEFAINDSVSPTTGFSPFQLMYGISPRKPIDMITRSKALIVEEFIKGMTTAISHAQENIMKAQTSMKIQADKHHRDHPFQIRDKVMLNTQNLNLRATHSHKLSHRWIRPFPIIGQKHKDSFKLDLPGNLKIHPIFHANLLKKWITNDDMQFPDRHQAPPLLILVNNSEEFEVDAIINK